MTQYQHYPYQISAPFTMTVSPDGKSGTFQVTNTGTQPITVRESLSRLSPLALKYPAADHATTTHTGAPWLSVSPTVFTLAPGQAEAVHISARVPSGAQGTHYLNVVWAASPVAAVSGPLHLAGAVATTVGIPLPGIAVPAGPDRLPAAPHLPGGGGFSTVDMGGALCGVAVVAAAAVTAVRRRRRARRRVPAHGRAA
jgi:hypothetical protein